MRAWSLSAAHGTIPTTVNVGVHFGALAHATSPLNERANDSWEFEHAAGTERLC
jgi:hypothetical protein